MSIILRIIGVILIVIGIIGVLISPLLGTLIIIGGYILYNRDNINSKHTYSSYANHYDGRNSDYDDDYDDSGSYDE